MGTSSIIFLCTAALLLCVHGSKLTSSKKDNSKKIVCYFTNWAQYRPNEGKYVPEDIEPKLCTHLIFAFGWMKKHKISSFDSTDETKNGKKGMYERLVEIKNKNKDLKVLLAIGGWSFGTQRFKDMASNRYNRQLYVFSAIKYLRDRNFDGLDLDWEFPRGPDDKKNFVLLLKELREAFEEESKDKKLPRLLLTVAVSAGSETIRSGYDVPAVAAYCDFINIMSYDFHGKWESQTGHNSPLYALSTESQWRKQLCMEFGVKLWEKMGAPKEKIIVGLATYGRSFSLQSPDKNGMNVPTSGGGKAGTFSREEGFLAYYEVCDFIKKGAKYVWDDEQKVPYAYYGDQWVGFDDEKSIRIKLNWIKDNGYGGAMVWTLDMDDFLGNCLNGQKYPLIGAMGEELLGHPKRPITDLEALSIKVRKSLPPTPAPVLSEVNVRKDKDLDLDGPVEIKADPDATNARVACYYTSWSLKRPGQGKFQPEHIDPFLCTHVIFAFSTIKNDTLSPIDGADTPNPPAKKSLYDRILGLKEKNPKLKVLLSVGGWISGTAPFKQITKSGYRQSLFVFNAIEYLRQKGFDGLDIAWEFPRGAEDKEKFSNLIKDLYEAFVGEAKAAEKPRLLLTAAVPASFEAVAAGYDVQEINNYLDMMNVMTYDFHGNWERQVGHNSPLFALFSATSYQKKLTVDYSAKEWVEKGASKEKLLIGIPTYGRSFTLKNTSLTDIGAPAIDGGKSGNYTGEPGVLAFFEVCDFLKSGAILVWDNEQMVPYAYKGNQWVGFDDQRSLKTKVQWLKEAGYGGVMLWSIDMDDFRGSCMGLKYPLINTIKEELKGYNIAKLEVLSSNILNSLLEKDEVVCEEEDGHISYHVDKKECAKYYMCEGKRRHHMPCPVNLVFNPNENVCDWPENVDDCASVSGGRTAS
ncbi:probable chitinase 10 isoform X2 [Parasteatoda tepidariorum]|uniref:probable chitinase 10 isoform X1 n=1 Tax=Parasteatoda tepidariorum TaxID=114398 RepID=UPI001C72010E|nr:probable chitinase 10 [Parasteatoda tepidariorum]